MRNLIILTAVLSFLAVGCKKVNRGEQEVSINAESLSLSEAENRLAPPVSGANPQITVSLPREAEVVVNKDAESLTGETGFTPAAETDYSEAEAIQRALKNLGLYAGEVDGKIGPKTKKAIKDFQRQNGLVEDGKVGPKTRALLFKS